MCKKCIIEWWVNYGIGKRLRILWKLDHELRRYWIISIWNEIKSIRRGWCKGKS